MQKLLARPAVDVAPGLLGAVLKHGDVAVRLTEVEAYMGSDDPGSHAYRGKTARNAVMFGPAGYIYVYFTYGMHFCANIVCGAPGEATAVLLRAGEIVEGEALARSRRPSAKNSRDLARGPARLASALGLTREHNGVNIVSDSDGLMLIEPSSPVVRVESGPRVGVPMPGGDGQRYPWRFWIKDDPTVSPYRAHRPRTPR